ALLGQQGGWPLTMFLTPEGEPFWGGTYFPPESKWGRPGFPEVLERVEAVFHNEKDLVEKNRAALTERLESLSKTGGDGTTLRDDSIEQVAEAMIRQVDFEQGGLQGAPKFPNPSIFMLFWRAWQKTGIESYKQAVITALERMSEGGIYDHLGGGYARYSVDPQWLAPHFEKMLYDNAQLLDLLRMAWAETQDPLFEQRIIETIGWVEREMIAENGAFAATLDADSEGEEGKFYVWHEEEIRQLLGPGDATDRFCEVYGVTPSGNWEGKTILNRLHLREKPGPKEEAELAAQRQTLFAAREQRIHPGWDDKVLADWNGLMIAALASASAAFGKPFWLDLAIGAYRAVRTDLSYED
ncbi:MAG: DUF255 domain-containing protein, partial [Alphaproteobacteria bacterium]|nr:DUF255 domain-containing protein [Alphaproteobacteria bacterium]